MMTVGNVEELRKRNQGYLVGLQRRNRKDTFDYIQQAEARTDWRGMSGGDGRRGKKPSCRRLVWSRWPEKEPGVRGFVVHSEEREAYERGLREMSLERVRKKICRPCKHR